MDEFDDGRLPIVARGAEVKSVNVIMVRHVLWSASLPDGIRLKVLKLLVDAAVRNLDVNVGDAESDGRRRSVQRHAGVGSSEADNTAGRWSSWGHLETGRRG